MRIIYSLVILIIFTIGMSFALQNADPVALHYYVGQKTAPLSLWLIIAMGVGIIWGMLFCLMVNLRLRRTIMSLNRKIKTLEKV